MCHFWVVLLHCINIATPRSILIYTFSNMALLELFTFFMYLLPWVLFMSCDAIVQFLLFTSQVLFGLYISEESNVLWALKRGAQSTQGVYKGATRQRTQKRENEKNSLLYLQSNQLTKSTINIDASFKPLLTHSKKIHIKRI